MKGQFEMQNNHYDKAYDSYEQWKENEKQKLEAKKRKRKPAIIAFMFIFCIGLFGTGLFVGKFYENYIRSSDILNIQKEPLPQETPKLKINETASGSKTGDDGLTGSEIYQKVSNSVVGIISQSITTQNGNTGSGIIMTNDGYIITNNHVVEGGDKISVILANGERYEAEFIGGDAKTDLAILKIDPKNELTPAEFGNSDKLIVGERAFAIGSPGGLELQNSLTGGYISAINRDVTVEDRVMTLIQTDASINPGNSGGPLINQYGQIIGINTIKIGISYYEGLGFAIPINSAKTIIDELLAYGYIKGRPAIGISGRNLSEQSAFYYELPQGLLVDYVDPRSDAYLSGVKKGDIIIGVNGTVTKTMSEVNKVKESFKAGDKITLNIYRAGKKLDIKITLMDEKSLENIVPQEEEPVLPKGFFEIP